MFHFKQMTMRRLNGSSGIGTAKTGIGTGFSAIRTGRSCHKAREAAEHKKRDLARRSLFCFIQSSPFLP